MMLDIVYWSPDGNDAQIRCSLPAQNIDEAIQIIEKWPWVVYQWTLKRQVETRHNYQPVVEWLEKFPKYVKQMNLKTGKILIANVLYCFG